MTGPDMGERSSSELMLFLLLAAELCFGADIQISVEIPNLILNLTDAKLLCQRNHTDLVTWNMVEMFRLASWMAKNDVRSVWISRQGDPEQESNVNLLNAVDLASVDNGNGTHCSSFAPVSQRWYTTMCSAKYHFVCYEDNLVLVTENKTWEDALEHCRKMTTPTHKWDLLSLPHTSDYSYVRERLNNATTDEVWKGLRFMGGEWIWLNGEMVDHQNMLPDCPTRWKYCGTVSKYDTDNWIVRDCSERRNFICYYKKIAP